MQNTGSKNPSSQNPSVQSFLESLRQQSFSSGSEQGTNPNAFEKFQEKKRLEEQRKAEFFQARKKEFHEVYSLKKRQNENQIKQIQERLKTLAASIKKLNQEVAVAVSQDTPVKQTGKYHESFFEHLNQMIDLLKRQVDNSRTWLHLYNQRSRKKSYFWGQVQKSGSSFLLSGERTTATSIG